MNGASVSARCVDVGGRQVHYRHAGSGPAVVLLHASPRSSASLLPLMAAAPCGVSLFAFDTPGYGLSDALSLRRPDITDFADALGQTLDALGIARAACYATHTGAAVALALAVREPQRLSRLVIDGVSAFDAAERAAILHSYLPPFSPQVDGTHMAWLWSRVRDQALFFPWNHRGTGARRWLPLPDAAALQAVALDLLCAADHRAAYSAAFHTDAAAWVAQLRVPALIGARPGDMLLPHLQRLGAPPAGVRIESLPDSGTECDALLWHALTDGLGAEPAAPAAADAALPHGRVGDRYVGADGARLHLRGTAGSRRTGTADTRPRVLLHASPGGPRSLDDVLATAAAGAAGPVIAPSLPGHAESAGCGESTTAGLVDRLAQALLDAGVDDAVIAGTGAGAALAAALAARRPAAWRCEPPATAFDALAAAAAADVPRWLPPRDDGGHLFAAWQQARDEAILGPWWHRPPRHAFGDTLDVAAIHRNAVERLKEAPAAAAWRQRLQQGSG